jgi:uncharacterized membrane protein
MAYTHIITSTRSGASLPIIRKLRLADLKDVLAKGWDDFREIPTHAVFLIAIYPIIGLALAAATLNYDLFPMLFPLVAGFALIGPFAALGIYELSRLREQGGDVGWMHAFAIHRSPSFGAIAALGVLLAIIFLVWLAAAQAIYVANFGYTPATAIPDFVTRVLTTEPGWNLIIVGVGVGFLFAVTVLIISVISFPLLLDRELGAADALLTSVRVVIANPLVVAVWGMIVAGLLVLGSLPCFLGLTVVLPVLGHATWHLYRKAVEPEPVPRRDSSTPARRRHYAAQFPASIFAGEA